MSKQKEKELIKKLKKRLKDAVHVHKTRKYINHKTEDKFEYGLKQGHIRAYNTVLLWLEDYKKELVLEEK